MPLSSRSSTTVHDPAECEQLVWKMGLQVGAAREERDRHIRAFNSLEKNVTRHIADCPDCEDLARAHKTIMLMLAEGEI